MLKIRLQRRGKRNQPFFRIIVTEKENAPRGGRALEILGFLNPLTKEKQLKPDRINHWLSVGAQPSDRVHNLLVTEGIIKGKKRPVHAKPKKKDEAEGKEAPAQAGFAEAKQEAKPAEHKEEETKPEEKKQEEKLTEAEDKEKPAEEKPKEETKPADSSKQEEEQKKE